MDDWTDSAIKSDSYRRVALLALTEKDIDNIETVTGSMKSVRNHGVAIRRLVAREAKRIRTEAPTEPEVIEGQLTIEDFGL